MKLLGTITRKMFYTGEKTFMTPELETYTIPHLGGFLGIDVGRQIYLNDEGQVVLEPYKAKKSRELQVWISEQENPIVQPKTERSM